MNKKRLISYCDSLVSKIVIARDRRCICCGTSENLTCGHFFKRGFMAIRFDLVNCNAQCASCNSLHNEDTEPYKTKFKEKYGMDEYLRLCHEKDKIRRWKDFELEELKEKLKQILEDYKGS